MKKDFGVARLCTDKSRQNEEEGEETKRQKWMAI